MASNKQTNNQATLLWQKQAKCNAEFFALTYGALVAELLRDLEDAPQIQAALDKMGHSIGVRCIEEVLAKSSEAAASTASTTATTASSTLSSSLSSPTTLFSTTSSFVETTELIRTALRMFLGITVEVPQKNDTAYTLQFSDNPLALFVELPDTFAKDLEYSQLLAGMVRGMLEMLQFEVSCKITNSVLRGGDTNEMRVELKQILQADFAEEYQEE